MESEPEMMILGVPLSYVDKNTRYLNLNQKFTNTKQIASDENIAIRINIDFDFEENNMIYEYYRYDDIVSSLGGIAASLKICTGVIATVTMIQFIYELADVFQRKYQYKYQKQEIFRMLAYFETIVKKDKEVKLYYGLEEVKRVEEILENRI